MSTDSDIPSAANRVLHIFELLEAILLDVDDRTLLVSAQRVNKRWWNVIGNPNFQKRLFFIPDHDALGSTVNPLLLEYFAFCLHPRPIDEDTHEETYISQDRTPPSNDVSTLSNRNLNSTELVAIKDKAEAFSRVEASWRRMFTHQPPRVGIHQQFHGRVDPSFRLGIGCPKHNYEISYQEQHVDKFVRMSTVIEYFFRPDKAVDHRFPHEFPPWLRRVVMVKHFHGGYERWRRYGYPHGPYGQVFFYYHVMPESSDSPCHNFAGLGEILLLRRSWGTNCVWYLKSKLERMLQLMANYLELQQDLMNSANGRPRRGLYKYFQNSDVERGLQRLRNFFGLQTQSDDED
ncbi:hypothetical protein PFICI_08839 [Pestalotiopsis fici W106-1]|uniref:Rhodanese domain-containing protein n=1 Tax=Pestalotiopsis fici (strain W106-1 / CGMCC3.15140) TaxID=1229662 RepID=W3X1E2_PESFW|nr:uncharacterized protein PFICI_08839 [Pestalotiopsis fici W106-1]ETS78986.1 hypothetical protein PFICI_08839 [Pestalotiopsis fici W106-1]